MKQVSPINKILFVFNIELLRELYTNSDNIGLVTADISVSL
jgi:hypothetical protein